MTKKNILLAASGVLCLATLFAFTAPKTVRDNVFTLFFPEKTPPIAVEHARAPLAKGKKPRVIEDLQFGAPRDTNPPLQERYDDFINGGNNNPIDLKDPSAIQQQVEYDPATNMYIITEKIGDDFYRAPTYMTFDDYLKWREEQQQREYFDRLQGVASAGKSGTGAADPIAKFDLKTSLIDRLFGGTNVDIRPQGNINLTFGFDYQKIQNPVLTLRQQSTGNFDFDMDINMSATGKIGEKLNLNFNYNTQATFDIDNQMKLHYDTKGFSEDEIVQNIEAGNVSMPLRSNLIKGAQNLFGIKTELKFGHLHMTLLASQQRSKQQSLTVQGGAQIQQFEVPIDEYDENRHFFISHWNRGEFEPSLKCLPVPLSLFNITRMEVWITNDKLATENVRDIVAITDLGEPKPLLSGGTDPATGDPLPDYRLDSLLWIRDIKGQPLPDNDNNQLYPQMRTELIMDSTLRQADKVVSRLSNQFELKQIRDFEKVRARLLSPSEYTYNEQLGFISINLNVQPDQVVGVALEYTYNGQAHKIGEFTSDVPSGDSLNQNVLFVKMLKSTTANVRYPIWDLMMKNIYAIGSANVDPQEFLFDIYYEDPGKGQKRFLDGPLVPQAYKARPLLQIFNLDNLNRQGDPGADGIFDFVPGLTVNLRSGRVMFPVLEPFGDFLINKFQEADPTLDSMQLAQTLAYTQLYDSTLFRAREFQQLNRFTLRGSYKSSTSSEISLGTFNLPQGSVRVSAGGRQLVEGADYIVDYNIGKIKILNDAILQSGQNVSVSFEDNTAFGFQSRTMLGARFDYELSRDVTLGATFLNLFERPLTQKVNFGDDPINNRMYGLDFAISKDAPWLTRAVDALPLISTKEPSSITAQAEVAVLDPGHSRAINQGDGKGGIVYIDDFEGSTSNLPLALPANQWAIASVPQGDNNLFPESSLALGDSSLALGANRSRLSWYLADPSALRSVDADNPYARQFDYQDIFPNRQLSPAENSYLRPLDVTIYPRERGPYNFELPDGYPGLSAGLTSGGELVQPETRWSGFMKGLNTNDFEASNIEFIEFWMLNPYMDKGDGSAVSQGGDMYIDLGTLSEDIMRDSRQFFENALPTGAGSGATANTRWGRIPVLPPIVNAFDNDPDKRELQDIGLDGLNDEGERNFPTIKAWLDQLPSNLQALFSNDPSNDNFTYFNDPVFADDAGIRERYRRFNGTQGNSPVTDANSNITNFATNYPDREDFNQDNSLNETEAYFRYKIPLAKVFDPLLGQEVLDSSNAVLASLITDKRVVERNGQTYVFYRFKLPLDAPAPIRTNIGGIGDFRSIRFIRMFWKGFDESTTFRFATLELGRNQWRRYTQQLSNCDVGNEVTPFDVNAVSIEENSARQPFNYTIPPGISRENSVGAFPDILQNEQALAVDLCDLNWCDARGIFKTLNMDLRQFDRLKMFVHGEGQEYDYEMLDSNDLTVFIRLGSDFFTNYYEYEIHLSPSQLADLNGNNNPDDPRYKEAVWKPQNNIDFPLDLLTAVKTARNADPNAPLGTIFAMPDPENPANTVKVIGNPNLGYVKGIMIGVRNVDPNMQPHCVEIWVNELRLNGFNEKGGIAGLARVDMKLADFAQVSLAGSYSGIGWGSIEQKLIQRQREEVIQYDFSSNIELGKLLPESSGIRIPFYVQYSNTTKIPEYDPYDLDIKLRDKIREESDPLRRDTIRQQALDVTTVRGYNFTNVRKERRGGRKVPLPWDIENFSVTYAFNQLKKRNPFIINDQQDQYKGGLDYQYATTLKPIQPFKKLIKKDKFFKWLTEFNFNPLPNTYGFNTNVERLVGITTWRFAGEDPALNTYYNRRFTWDRNYDLGWDISRSLRFNFDAQARSLIDEPQEYRADGQRVTKQERRDSIWTNIRSLGRPKLYGHNASLNYTLPFKTIPFMEWITMKASYTAGYTWTAQSLKLQYMDAGPYAAFNNSRNLGNVIQNSSVRQINGDFNFEQLYNRSKYLAKINKPRPAGGSGKTPAGRGGTDRGRPGADDSGSGGGDDTPGAAGGKDDRTPTPRDRSKPNARDAAGGTGRDGAADGSAPNTGGKDKNGKDKDKKKNKDREPSVAERIALRPLMLVRKARFTYSENFSTVVPGFTPETRLMGLSEGFVAPGWAFVAGLQPESNWLDEAGRRGWITQRPELNQQVMRNYTQNFDAAVTVEPFRDFRIELNANRQYVRNNTELFKDQNFNLSPDSVDFQHRAARDLGSFTISYFSLNTLFNNDLNGLFARYESYRSVISTRLGQEAGNLNPHPKDGPEYRQGYGKIQQEVLLPAFVAAYTDQNPNTVNLNLFRTRPSVNWKLNYNGLSKIGKLSRIFSSVQITHGYKSTLTVNSYNTDLFYDASQPYVQDELSFNYIARYEIPQVVINEQFAPLFGLDVKLKNDMTFRADFKKQRTLAMSFIDYQLAETRSTAYTVGFGYRLKNVNIPFLTGKKAKKSAKARKPKPGATTPPGPGTGTAQQGNDMNFKFDFEVRDDITVNHRLDQLDEAVPTRGARTISINPSVDYALNKRLKLRLFTDFRKTVPKTSQSFPITTLNAGVTVQFSLN